MSNGATFTMEQVQALLAAERAKTEELVKRLAKQEVGSVVGQSKGLPTDKMAKVFADHNRARCDSDRIGQPEHAPERRDWRTIVYPTPTILSLPFTYEGERMTIGELPCSRITPEIVDAFTLAASRSLTTGARGRTILRDKKGAVTGNSGQRVRAPSTVDRMVTAIQIVVAWAAGGKDNPRAGKRNSPLKGLLRLCKKGEGRRGGHFADEPELDSFLVVCRPTLADMWRLAVNAGGMRRDELRLLITGEIDEARRVIRFPWLKQSARGVEISRTKSGDGRFFGVRDQEWPMVERRIAEAEERPPCSDTDCKQNAILAAHGKSTRHWHLFPSDLAAEANPVQYKTLGNWQRDAALAWKDSRGNVRTLANDERVTLHHARHTFASWAVAKGYGLESLLFEGGWADAEMAMAYIKQSRALIEGNVKLLQRSLKEATAERFGAHAGKRAA